MKVTLLDRTLLPAYTIGRAAAICYDADESYEKSIRRAQHCKDSGHLATMRFAYATVEIDGISRVTSHQLVRVAHAGILQQSQRYVTLSNIEYVTPPAIADTPKWFQAAWHLHLKYGSWLYAKAIELGVKKQDARYILSQSCTTKLRMCLNFQGWQDLLKNRTSKSAQWEAQNVAVEIEKILQSIAPEIF